MILPIRIGIFAPHRDKPLSPILDDAYHANPIAMTSQNTAISEKRAHRRYYYDTYAYTYESTVREVGEDMHGVYLIPQETIFHPQGGGQPADEGSLTIDGTKTPVAMLHERQKEGFIKHYYVPTNMPLIAVGTSVSMEINAQKRLLFAAYHTAGHLLAELLGNAYPTLQGIKGNHFPGQGAVIFIEKTKKGIPVTKEDYATYDLAEMKAALTKQIAIYQQKGGKVDIAHRGPRRTMQIGSFSPLACGGTHLHHTRLLQDFHITKVAFKKKEGIKVSYTVGHTAIE